MSYRCGQCGRALWRASDELCLRCAQLPAPAGPSEEAPPIPPPPCPSDLPLSASGQRERAVAWLAALLASGPRASVEVAAAARREGISDRTLRRARRDLEVLARRRGTIGGSGLWVLILPESFKAARRRPPV